MSDNLTAGDKVSWSSHGETAHGKVVRKITEEVTIKGHKVAASEDGKQAAHKPSALRKA